MNYRILHCGKLINNYNLCLEEKVAGFTRSIGKQGDMVYIAVRNGKKTVCGGRGVLSELTDYKPWEDSERYSQCFTLNDIEYCTPFDISILKKIGGKYWNLKYLQGARAINDTEAINLLKENFARNITKELFKLNIEEDVNDETNEDFQEINENELTEALEEVPEAKIDIMGTFQTIKFLNETDKIQGLEMLVTENFYNLFSHFKEEKTILIAKNRMFSTESIEDDDGDVITGISGVPDSLLVSFNKDINKKKSPFQINLIEYECYGENKITIKQKTDYLNRHIIPQLMRFASAFSVITDSKIRSKTISNWVNKIMEYIENNEEIDDKVSNWIREIYPDIKDKKIDLRLKELLTDAFESNVRIILIIDELTPEQKETIKNIISSFKLNSIYNNNIDFTSYVVRLEQKINIVNKNAEYALAYQG